MRLTVDVIESAKIFLNPLEEREINLRGLKIPEIENLGATRDQCDVIDLSDNDIRMLENLPQLKRLRMIILNNNQIESIQEGIEKNAPNLDTLILTNNHIADLSEVDKLHGLRKLQSLSLIDNPICLRKQYRLYTIHRLPWLKFLDFEKVKTGELDEAVKTFGSKEDGEVNRQNTATKNEVNSNGLSASAKAERAQILEQIRNATTQEEIDRLEKLLRT